MQCNGVRMRLTHIDPCNSATSEGLLKDESMDPQAHIRFDTFEYAMAACNSCEIIGGPYGRPRQAHLMLSDQNLDSIPLRRNALPLPHFLGPARNALDPWGPKFSSLERIVVEPRGDLGLKNSLLPNGLIDGDF